MVKMMADGKLNETTKDSSKTDVLSNPNVFYVIYYCITELHFDACQAKPL